MSDLFRSNLLKWYNPKDRPMPWKDEKDPYKIWLSEIILQQTTVAQGWNYYLKFISHFPTVFDLANASEQEVLKLWEGLGYYSRARNLYFAAHQIVDNFGGQIPNDYKSILTLKGVGPYTASAIASFAFGLPYAVVDGNVKRVVSRYLGSHEPIDIQKTYNKIEAFVSKQIIGSNPAVFNQGIIDFGATVCTPKNYKCDSCPLQKECVAYKENTQSQIPVKSKKIIKKKRFFNCILIEHRNGIYVEKRTNKDIWENLYQLPIIERTEETDIVDWTELELNLENKIISRVKVVKQLLTHQIILFHFYQTQLPNSVEIINTKKYKWISFDEIKNYPFPKSIQNFLTNKGLIAS